MWLLLSLGNAFSTGLQNAYYKKIPVHISPLLTLWGILIISSILFSPLFLFGVPHLNTTFFVAVFIRIIIDTFATTLYVKGVKLSPLSVTVPMVSLGPLAIFVTQFFINHLLPTPLGFAGVIVTVGGLYYLNFDHDTKDLLSPFKAVYKEKGAMLVATAAILWSFVTSLQKLGIENSSLYFFTAFSQLAWAICLTPIILIINQKGFRKLMQPKTFLQFSPAGIFDAIQVFLQYFAYTLALPVYVNTVGNTSILFSSLFGWIFYKEKLQKHIVPTIIIIIGITLITFAQK